MDLQPLISTGLTKLQAQAYALLIEHGQLTPPQVATRLKITRTNAYKLLDKLAELGLVIKKDVRKKFAYSPNNPLALANMIAAERNTITAREQAVRDVTSKLLAQYYEHTEKPTVQMVSGRQEVADAYRAQINQSEDVYFIRTRMDIPSLGFDTMHEIRTMPGHHGNMRYGINPDITKGKVNPDADKRGHLVRTWVRHEDYDAPVEWSISGSSLLIVLFGDEPHAITIINPIVAQAFLQLWKLLDTSVRAMPYYSSLPRLVETAS